MLWRIIVWYLLLACDNRIISQVTWKSKVRAVGIFEKSRSVTGVN